MQFSKKYFELRAQFNPGAEKTAFPDSGIMCQAFRFDSAYPVYPGKKQPGHSFVNNAIFWNS